MKTQFLALPAPSLARHLARTIDGRSLTGIPGAWSAAIKRRPFRRRKVKLTPYQLDYLLRNCTGSVNCHNPPHPKTTLWCVATNYADGGLSLSCVWAIDKKSALRSHRHGANSQTAKEINVAAFPIGGKKK